MQAVFGRVIPLILNSMRIAKLKKMACLYNYFGISTLWMWCLIYK